MKVPSRLGRGFLALACCVSVVACGQGAPGPGTPEATREPSEQSFGPTYPAQPPDGRRVRIDTASLSQDKLKVTITFVGGPPYLPSDPCSADYEPWVATRGDTLDVVVAEILREHTVTSQTCPAIGIEHVYHLALAAPFVGTTVKGLGGGTFYVVPPAGLALASRLPRGWTLQRSFEQDPGPPPIWVQVYAATTVADGPIEGPGSLVLYEAFGLIGEWSDVRAEKARERGATQLPVHVNGAPEVLWQDGASGELLLSWTLDGASFGLVGNTADMTADQLVSIAEGVTYASS